MKTVLAFRVSNSGDVKDDFEWRFDDAPPVLKPGDCVVTSDPSKSVVSAFEIHGPRTVRKEGSALIIHYLVRCLNEPVKAAVSTKAEEG